MAPCSSDEENDETGKSIVLLKEAETEASKKADSVMEVTWDVETMDDTILDNKKKKCEPTPWEKYLEKRKAKRKVDYLFNSHFAKRILIGYTSNCSPEQWLLMPM